MLLVSKLTRILTFLIVLCACLFFARTFLIPVTLSAMIAMLLTPFCSWFEKRAVNRILATLFAVLFFIIFINVIMAVLSWQVSGLFKDVDQITAQINKIAGTVQEFIAKTFDLTIERQQQMIMEHALNMSSNIGSKVSVMASSLVALIGKSLLSIVYVFLFLYYRDHLKSSFIRFIRPADKERVEKIIDASSHIALWYISGLVKMIIILWVMYGIGFSVVGVKHALFFAMLCGLLEIVPYLGNITGSLLTAIMAFAQGGSSMALWILLVYGIVQFTQTYLLEPLVVGAKVDINPLFTILIIVVGEILWGVPGMILAVPLFGIVKIVCDNVPNLEAFSSLIGVVKVKRNEPNM